MAPSGPLFKIKLASGRVLGPLDLERVRLLVSKNQIIGTEIAREYPQGEWKDINLIPPLAEVLVAKAAGQLKDLPESEPQGYGGYRPISGGPVQIEQPGSTQVLPGADQVLSVGDQSIGSVPDLQTVAPADSGDEEKTVIAEPRSEQQPDHSSQGGDEDKTQIHASGVELQYATGVGPNQPPREISQEKTVIFQRSTETTSLPGKPTGGDHKKGARDGEHRKGWKWIRAAAIGIAALAIAYEAFVPEPDSRKPLQRAVIRPRFPSPVAGNSDPKKSQILYEEAMKHYLQDTVEGYRMAAARLFEASALDATHVKALAMLASAYLNLIDSSNKDENYFAVISKLIESSRAKASDLPETVIAEVEFFVTIGRAEAAQNRIVEYTRTHKSFGLEMFFYLAYAFYSRGDYASAARYISQIPDNKVFTARVFHLRGLIAEKLGDEATALREYGKAVELNPRHAVSRLRMSDLLGRQGKLRHAAPQLEFLVTHMGLLPPKEMARAYYLHAQFLELDQKWEMALADIERAARLDLGNHDYLLELYTLRARSGESSKSVQKQARMYYFLGEGEKRVKLGKYQEALTQFLEARQADLSSTLPLVKIGDMFFHLNHLGNAKLNYKLAADRAPNSIAIWSKYINTLILSFEWEEAQRAMDRFRKLPVSQSAIDKAAGDMYAKQGKHAEAQVFYKKAMARDTIDPDVYIAYARSLMATKNFKDAPFFFALALRFDPFNTEARIGTARCIAESESIEEAITQLQDELQKAEESRAELLAAIAELQIKRGEWEVAQQYVDQAVAASPEYAYPWKLQAQIHMNREGVDRNALEKALAAYKSYSDRNSSDPSGYLERYRIFIRKAEFQKADEELGRIYSIYPKYPNLHYYKGSLYSVMGNHKAAIEEFERELKNNPNEPHTYLAMGKVLLDMGAVRDALDRFNRAMQLAPQMAEPKHLSGYANYLLKNYAGAVALYQAALAIDPGNSMIYKRLGVAYRDMGNAAGARGAFRKYLEMEPDAPDRAQFERYL